VSCIEVLIFVIVACITIFFQRIYSTRFKLLECFDWNTNIKESMRNL
jgi:hypothetical protein